MPTTFSSTPTFVVPARQCQITFALAGGNYLRAWVTAAPEGSEFATKLKESTQHRALAYQGDAASKWNATFDVGGKYTIVTQEYTRGTSYGGGYENDPNGAESETKVGSETTLSLFVGQRLTAEIGVSPDTATLVLWVWDSTIRPTTLAVHGEKSPCLVKETPTPLCKLAMESTSVLTAVAALENVLVSTSLGTISTIATELITRLTFHLSEPGVHALTDSYNVISKAFKNAATPTSIITSVAELVYKYGRHVHNDGGLGAGPGEVGVHVITGTNVADWTNSLVAPSPGDLAGVLTALADVWRCYEAHRVNLSVHLIADTSNVMTALPVMLLLHKAFLTVLASQNPTPSPAQSTGAALLIAHGFVE